MFDRVALEEAVDLQQKSYQLFRWIGQNLQFGVFDFNVVHKAMSTSDAAREWIGRHFHSIPPDLRPGSDQLEKFACLFSSYLTTSFELRRSPGKQLASHCGCYCPYCAFLTSVDHLKTKNPSKHAKDDARGLKRNYLESRASDLGISPSYERLEEILNDRETAEDLALAAYGEELIRRTQFASQGESVLVLWRQFAWKESRAPKPKFRLDAQQILAAEKSVIERLNEQ